MDSNIIDKSGWLRKQGGLVKNWQQRWFVLQGQQLHYFKDDSQTKLLGTIDLAGNKLIEKPYNRDEPDKWLFDICPGPGRGEKMSSTHDTYPLWANSDQERSEWTGALRRSIYKDVGGGVFGGPLKDVMAYDYKAFGYDVPHVVHQCVERIRFLDIKTEGIFRLSGRISLMKELRRQYDEGERPEFMSEDSDVDIHTACSLLKLYLRTLSKPLIPYEMFETFLSLGTSFKAGSNTKKTLKSIKALLKEIPIENFQLLDYFTNFLREISLHHEVNKMTEENIALCFGTSIIIRSIDSTVEFELAIQKITTAVLLAFVKWHDPLFCYNDQEMEDLVVNKAEVEDLVNISETPIDVIGLETDIKVVAPDSAANDLLDINFSQPSCQDAASPAFVKQKPPIPPRAADKTDDSDTDSISLDSDVDNGCQTGKPPLAKASSLDTLMSNDQPECSKPKPAPRTKKDPAEEPVVRRSSSTKRPRRPAPLVGIDQNSKNNTVPVTRVGREPSGFQSYIDSPLDARYSLNMGDLPSSMEDLQTLVLTLKITLKDQRRANDKLSSKIEDMKAKHSKELQKLTEELQQERQAKADALEKILQLNIQLINRQ